MGFSGEKENNDKETVERPASERLMENVHRQGFRNHEE
jgi:hypothetical protein